MQHEPPRAFDRAAVIDANVPGARFRHDVQLMQQLAKGHIRGRLVHDQPHRALARMGAKIDHRLPEPWIAHARHRHQKLSGQRNLGVAHAPMMCRVGAIGKGDGHIGSPQRDFFIARRMDSLRVMLRILLPLLAALPAPLLAQGAVPDGVVSVEMIPGWRTDEGSHMAALEITLAPGWKTYWRAPGDAGIPPEFQWSAAENVSGLRVHWPVPEVSHTNGMRTIGYSGRVVIPLEFMTPEAGVSARLAGELDIGLCADICVPIRVPLSAVLPPTGGRTPEIIAALLDAPESADQAGVRSVGCDVSPISDGLRVEVPIVMPGLGGGEDVGIETADPQVWVSEPVATRSGGQLTATADLVHVTGGAFALDRGGLRVTVLNGARAVDIRGRD